MGDFHLGCAAGTLREHDCFAQASQAIVQALAAKADLIVVLGDIYDTRVPRQETWAESFSVLQKALLAAKSSARLAKTINRLDNISPLAFSGVPIVALHGNHDSRGASSVNAVQALEQGGFLAYLHKAGLVLEKNGERVCVQGMGWVPDDRAQSALQEWKPAPEPGAYNLFLFHQSLEGHVYSDEDRPVLRAQDLPAGFDLYADGHLHVAQQSGKIVFAGSTVITQQKREETAPKGFFMLDTQTRKAGFQPLEKQRRFVHHELRFNNAAAAEVIQACRQKLEQTLQAKNQAGGQPLVRLKLSGTMKPGSIPVTEEEISRGFDALVSVQKNLEAQDFRQKIEQLRELHQQKLGVEQLGMQMLNKLLEETKYSGLPPEEILDELANGEEQKVVDKVLKKVT